MPMMTVKRKERSNRMSAHVINRSRVMRSYHTECAFVLTKMRRGQWNRKNMQEDGTELLLT